MSGGLSAALARVIAGQVCLHACMAGTRLAAPLLALRQGYGEAAVGVLLALFALTQVFLALPAGRYADRHGLRRPMAWSAAAAAAGAARAARGLGVPGGWRGAGVSGGPAPPPARALHRPQGPAA
ncbi:MAG: MFS transporter, partial [Ramlibacter sp.]|nr:MFS transporter [Ramlibacter sp.]